MAASRRRKVETMSGNKTVDSKAEPTGVALEYVAGTLRGAERQEFEQQLKVDDNLQHQVGFWEQNLQSIIAPGIQRLPARDLWSRISARLQGSKTVTEARSSIWASFLQWGFPTIAVLILAVVVIGYQPAPGPVTQTVPDYVAVLTNTDGEAVLTALTTKQGNNIYLKWEDDVAIEQQKNVQLWAISKRDGYTRPLAVLTNTDSRSIPLDEATWRLVTDSAYLLLTEEEEGGSPLDEPSEVQLAKGVCVRFTPRPDKDTG